MPNKFEIEIPITLKGDKGGVKIGEKIAEQIKKSLGSIGIGKKGAAGAGAGGGAGVLGAGLTKMTGLLAIIAAVVEGMSFILKPIMSLFKVILMLLFLPLVPILKPTMQALAAFIKWFAPVMMSVSNWIEKVYYGILDFIVALILGVKGVFKGVFAALGAGWDMIKNAGKWIWDNILMPGFMVLGDLGLKIWGVIKGLFIGTIDAVDQVWDWFKGLFEGTIDVIVNVWDWFKGLFEGTINVATTLWNWFKGLFGIGRKSRSVEDAIITPQGVVHTDPQDFIIATKNPAGLGGSVVININNPSVRQDSDINKLANQVSIVLQRQMPRRFSQ